VTNIIFEHIVVYVNCLLVVRPDRKKLLENPGIDRRIVLKWVFRDWNGGDMDSIDLALDGDRLRAFVNKVMDFRFP
jgi:hypothetical protein